MRVRHHQVVWRSSYICHPRDLVVVCDLLGQLGFDRSDYLCGFCKFFVKRLKPLIETDISWLAHTLRSFNDKTFRILALQFGTLCDLTGRSRTNSQPSSYWCCYRTDQSFAYTLEESFHTLLLASLERLVNNSLDAFENFLTSSHNSREKIFFLTTLNIAFLSSRGLDGAVKSTCHGRN